MPGIDVDINVDTNGAMRKFEAMKNEADSAEEEIAKELCEDARQNAERELTRQGSIGTGQGIESLHVQKLREGVYGLLGLNYLHYVHTGTKPHYPPSNYRLRVWAHSRGFSEEQLQEHIGQRGTRPHPWENQAFKPVQKSARFSSVKILKRKLKGIF